MRPPYRPTSRPPLSARHAAAYALVPAAERFPDLPAVQLSTQGLGPQDSALATAIHRTTLQRWITLETLLNKALTKPLDQLEAKAQAVLLTGAAQLLLMDRLPVHAVVDEQVGLAKVLIRPGAAGLVNAVLRKFADLVKGFEPDTKWEPARDLIPLDRGCVRLAEPLLPETDRTAEHLAVATSHPRFLVNRWLTAWGKERAIELCFHGIERPPTIVAVEEGFQGDASTDQYAAHSRPGFVVWEGDHASLVKFLEANSERRVQDPASAMPMACVKDLQVNVAMDYCAGRGTKTRPACQHAS